MIFMINLNRLVGLIKQHNTQFESVRLFGSALQNITVAPTGSDPMLILWIDRKREPPISILVINDPILGIAP